MIKLRDLQYFCALAKHKHFGRAADYCAVSQPTLSGQIIKLEKQLGLQLLERHKNNIMLTSEGEALAIKAAQVIQATEEFETTAKSLLDPLSGELKIGLIPTLAPYLLPYIITPLNQKLPKVDFYLQEDKSKNLLADLDSGKLDLLILPLTADMQKFAQYDLFTEPLVLAVNTNHPLARCTNIQLKDLDQQKLLTLEDGHCLKEHTLGYCFSAGAHEDKRYQATSLETLRHMVASNLGITLLPKLATMNLPVTITLSYVDFAVPAPARQIVLLMRAEYPRTQLVRMIVAEIRSLMKSIF